MKAYVINLDSREDRWESVKTQVKHLGIEVCRVSATTVESVVASPHVTDVIAATWQSHQKAMRAFLDTPDEFAFIMEDDFILSNRWSEKSLSLNEAVKADFLQLGFLITNIADRFQITFNGFVDFSLKCLRELSVVLGPFGISLKRKLLIREQVGVPFKFVCNDIRPGAHAYIVSRRFAKAVLSINSPEFLSADAAYMSMGWMRSFRMLRIRRSLVGQSDSISSINQRFLNS